MNIKQAKELDLPRVVEAAGAELDETKSQPSQERYFFKSCLPSRNEKTASLHVWRAKNGTWCWKDHGGAGEGGDIISFAQKMTGGTVSEALKWLDQYTAGRLASPAPAKVLVRSEPQPAEPKEAKYYILKSRHLFQKPYNKNLLAFINSRGISPRIVANYAKEIHFTDLDGYRSEAQAARGQKIAGKRKKEMFGLGLQNEALSWEVRTALDAFPKCVVGDTKDVTFIPAVGLPKRNLHVFEGQFDFYTWLEMNGQHDAKHPPAPVMVLNSSNLAARAAELINTDERFKQTENVIYWSQNDPAGEKSVMALGDALDHDRFTFLVANHLYADHKDLNVLWTATPETERPSLAASFRAQTPVQKFFDTSATAEARRASDRLRENLYKPKP